MKTNKKIDTIIREITCHPICGGKLSTDGGTISLMINIWESIGKLKGTQV
jgi:hypothetical protein